MEIKITFLPIESLATKTTTIKNVDAWGWLENDILAVETDTKLYHFGGHTIFKVEQALPPKLKPVEH